jgi:hypothetical protein
MRALISLKSFGLIAVVVLLFSTIAHAENQPSPSIELSTDTISAESLAEIENSATNCPPKTTRQMWFYKPPTNTSLDKVIKNHQLFILTRDDEDELARIDSAGAGPILQYIKFDAISDACFQAKKAKGTKCNCSTKPRANQVAWLYIDICDIRDNHQDWFLKDKNGNLIYWNEFVMMDPGSQGWREFWVKRIREYQAKYPKWDGVFIDNMSTRFGRHGDDFVQLKRYPTVQGYQDAVVGFLKHAQNAYFKPTKRQIFSNMAIRWGDKLPFLRYMDHMEGAMDEFWAYPRTGYYSTKEFTERFTRIEAAVKRGEKMLLVSQGTQTDYKRQLFGFASYLLLASPNTYFRYTNDQRYGDMWKYDNYGIRLGAPKSYSTRSGNTWTRLFSNGKVTVNPETRKATITIYKSC